MASRDRSTRSASSSMRDMSGGGGSRQMSGGMQSAQSAQSAQSTQSTQSTPSSSSEEEFLPQREERQNHPSVGSRGRETKRPGRDGMR